MAVVLFHGMMVGCVWWACFDFRSEVGFDDSARSRLTRALLVVAWDAVTI